MPQRRDPRIVMIGAGMSGIAAAHVLRQAGFHDFTILEKGSDDSTIDLWPFDRKRLTRMLAAPNDAAYILTP